LIALPVEMESITTTAVSKPFVIDSITTMSYPVIQLIGYYHLEGRKGYFQLSAKSNWIYWYNILLLKEIRLFLTYCGTQV